MKSLTKRLIFITIWLLNFAISENCNAKYFKYSRDYYLDIIMKNSSKTPLSNKTSIAPVYDQDDVTILFYGNVNEETQHGQTRLIILKGEKYQFSYQADSEICFVRFEMLRYLTGDEDTPYYDVPLTDIISGKRILIGGYFSDPYDGQDRPYLRRQHR